MTSGVSAGLGRRFAAALYDTLLLVAVLVILTTILVIGILRVEITPQTVGPWAYVYRFGLLAIIVAYYLLNWTRSGQTLGMRAWHLRAVTDLGKPLALKAGTVRRNEPIPRPAARLIATFFLRADQSQRATSVQR